MVIFLKKSFHNKRKKGGGSADADSGYISQNKTIYKNEIFYCYHWLKIYVILVGNLLNNK